MKTSYDRQEYCYQVRAREFWLEHKYVYFAIDMGLGKTGICINTIHQLELKTLVIAPLKVAYNTWPDEIDDWGLTGQMEAIVLHGPKKAKLLQSSAQIHVINYEGIPWLYKQLFEMHKANKPIPYKVLILDESTFIKDPTSKRFGYLCALRDLFQYIALLSGTPSPNSLLDLWAQYYILDKGKALGNHYNSFKRNFFTQHPYKKYSWSIKPGSDDAIHKAIAPRTFRLKSSDYASLPERVFNFISLDLSNQDRAKYDSFRKDFVLMLEKTQVESFNMASLSSKLRQFVQGAVYENLDDGRRITHYLHSVKVEALRAFCDSNAGKNVLCAVQFKFEVDMIRAIFPGVPAITGATSASDSNLYIKQWNQKELPLLLVHPKSVSRGLNLQHGGHIALWYAPTYSLDDYLQFNKRLHRTGQTETVVIHHLVMRNTIDEIVYQVLRTKDMTQEKLLEFLRKETKKWISR